MCAVYLCMCGGDAVTEFICRRESEGGWVGRWPEAQAAQFTHNAATRRLATFNGFLNRERGYRGEWCFSANVVCLCAAACVRAVRYRGLPLSGLEKSNFAPKQVFSRKVEIRTFKGRRCFQRGG